MPSDGEPRRSFSNEFDDEFPVGPQVGNGAFFGRNVLQGLIDGVDDYLHVRQPRWRRYRSIAPALLGSVMWINDEGLINKLGELSAACIVVTKQERRSRRQLAPLAELKERTPGMPVRAFSALTGLAPKVEGKPAVVGPYSPMYDGSVPTIRTLGFRTQPGSQGTPPILHAKLALLGHLWWHDEDGLGGEFGYWTEEPALVQAPSASWSSSCAHPKGSTPMPIPSTPTLPPSTTTMWRWLKRAPRNKLML